MRGQAIQELQLPVRVDLACIGTDRLHPYPGDGQGGADQRVGQLAGRQVEHEVVGGEPGGALNDVNAEYVGTHVAQGGGDRTERARAVGEYDP